MNNAVSKRNSSIELLKIFAVFLIVVNHVTQSIMEPSGYINDTNYLIDIGAGSTSILVSTLLFFRSFGSIGNHIFFIASCWFLLDTQKSKMDKVLSIIADTWLISMAFLIPILIIRKGDLSGSEILKQFFPLFFGNNWYISCYVIFLFIYPLLNLLIIHTDKKVLLASVLVFAFIFIFLNFVMNGVFYGTILTLWISIYLSAGYIKKYSLRLLENKKLTILLFTISLAANALLFFVPGIPLIIMRKATNMFSPLNICIAASLFNLARMRSFVNRPINFIASTSLFIYLIHENYLFRQIYRPLVFVYLYNNSSVYLPIVNVLLYSVVLFSLSLLLSIIYRLTVARLTSSFSRKISSWIGARFFAEPKKGDTNE